MSAWIHTDLCLVLTMTFNLSLQTLKVPPTVANHAMSYTDNSGDGGEQRFTNKRNSQVRGAFFQPFFLPFFPALCHGIRLMRETVTVFSSLFSLLPVTEG